MRRLLFYVLSFWVLLLFFPSSSFALGKKYEERFLKRIEWHKKMRTPYVWGGTDCSGTLAEAAMDAGLPFLRVTAHDMALGIGNWKSNIVSRSTMKPADLMWWTITKEREWGHVGTENKEGTFCHASFSKGYFTEESMTSKFYKQAVLFRHLTYGEDRE